jgi:hypothetical protein
MSYKVIHTPFRADSARLRHKLGPHPSTMVHIIAPTACARGAPACFDEPQGKGERESRWTSDFTLLHSQRCFGPHHSGSCDKRGHFAPDTRSTAEKYARKTRSRKLDPPGFQVPTREHSFTGLRVTEQSGASARSGLLPV